MSRAFTIAPQDRKEKTKKIVPIDLVAVPRDVSSTLVGVPLTGKVELLFQEVRLRRGDEWSVGYEALLRTQGGVYLISDTLDHAQREPVALQSFEKYVAALSSGKEFITIKDDGDHGYYYHIPQREGSPHSAVLIMKRKSTL